MKNQILQKIWDRIELEKKDSQLSYFNSLMYLGEVVTKTTCLFMLSGLGESQKNYKYTQFYKLVRANGIGEWSSSLDELLTGPSSQEMKIEYNIYSKELNDKTSKNDWQNIAVTALLKCLKTIDQSPEVRVNKIQLKTWFGYFAYLRNKTRGHGAITIELAEELNKSLATSIKIICEQFSPFKLQWAFLSQNLSGKYKVSGISEHIDNFAYLTSTAGSKSSLETGIYTFINEPIKIELIFTDNELNEFFFPNGSFRRDSFETLSYSTGTKIVQDGKKYLTPPGSLPKSETTGSEELRIVENCFTNIPENQAVYIMRSSLENELQDVLKNERHPIITLIGRGGIGKTTLAIKVLRDFCSKNRFENIFWFSSRDIDLMSLGAKRVQPDILDITDVVNVFNKLIGPQDPKLKQDERFDLFKQSLQDKSASSLFVFDNFETVVDQLTMFNWLDTHIRLPNKVLITSRMNEFKADYPISVGGMEYCEFKELITNVSEELHINELITSRYIDQLFEESSGHPYVAKILLGQVANEGKLGDIKRIMADQENLLQALFERTYKQLSAAAKRVFLTLGSWRSSIPRIAIEAVLKSTIDEKIDVELAIDELYKFSLIDKMTTQKKDIILSLPISAQLFAEKKLKTDIHQFAIKKDAGILMKLGVGRNTELKNGINDRISKFFQEVAKEVSSETEQIDKFIPIMEYISLKRPKTYLLYSTLLEEFDFIDEAIEACNKYIVAVEDSQSIIAWKRLIKLYKHKEDFVAEINSMINLCNVQQSSIIELSNLLKRYSHLLRLKVLRINEHRKTLSDAIIELATKTSNFEAINYDDKSNLGWIYLHNNQKEYAASIARDILRDIPDHHEAEKIMAKLDLKFIE
ncbi:NB-ARC domain-containing protein [Mesonia ostreae]|uniref:NB-ARC domain-containing protein n=1 Tax=Mesonia ostreae TaxID=861110 RepID=A0ABU2KKG4_9FLAO|nr:NB-ARC domain-containing protein [Mesonia ostreae]MDT0295174.1 NB-ARC domain-containing protein [Mesonia ostreae]